MDLDNVAFVFIGIFTGAVVTWLVTWIYYRKAGNELRQEATELRRLTKLVLHGLEDAGLVKLNRDASGRIIGLIIEMSATLTGTGLLSAAAEVIQRKYQNHSVPEVSDVDSVKDSG